ncbi:alpha/beta hydrolase [Roseateles sp. NT4]|uniref:alpha/beta hydrolase n=1 Tax=Roseateles sp. NT4 TaxID=3453715 RepID=UPI003EEA848B
MAIQTQPFRFELDGTTLAGLLHLPVVGAPRAMAVLTGPLTSVKEQAAGAYARALAERGIAALAFDHRGFGESGGQPRQVENPVAKAEEVSAAAAALRDTPGLARLPLLGIGVCAGAGYMARAVADDLHFQAYGGVAGYYSNPSPQSLQAAEPALARARAADARWRETGEASTIPAVAPEGGDVGMPMREAYEYYGTPRGAVPGYVNAYALQSTLHTAGFDAVGAAPRIRVPALVVHSEHALAPSLARRFIAGLGGPHGDLWLASIGQIDFYDQPALINAACDAMLGFFEKQGVLPAP